MATRIEVLVNGEVKLTVMGRFDSSGRAFTVTGQPLLNGSLFATEGITQTEAQKQIKSGKHSAALLRCVLKRGINPGGREVVDATERDRLESIDREANLTPAQLRRRELSILWSKVERCDRRNDDVDYHRLRGQALAAQDKFYADFPAELIADKAAELRAKAAKSRELASGALVYDADGWLSSSDQERRAADFRAEAAELERQADELEK